MNQLDVERMLADFRAWFEAVRTFDSSSPELAEGTQSQAAAPVDLATLVGQFVALKQEVNLQTRASRGQMEQNTQVFDQLRQSLVLLQRQQENLDDGQDEKLRPLLKSLVELYDALALARREVARIQEGLQLLLEQQTGPSRPAGAFSQAPPVIVIRLPWWARWLGLGKQVDQAQDSYNAWCARRSAAEQQTVAVAERIRQGVHSILTGYGMSLQRIDRALEQYDLEPIAALGQPFDPEQMEALELVLATGRPAGEVAEEIRRGYLWHGKVFRFAQVRVCQ